MTRFDYAVFFLLIGISYTLLVYVMTRYGTMEELLLKMKTNNKVCLSFIAKTDCFAVQDVRE